jgi:hypothetical protein
MIKFPKDRKLVLVIFSKINTIFVDIPIMGVYTPIILILRGNQMSDITKIRDKISKLREMAGSPNANEAAIALEKMHNLLIEYNLSEKEIFIKTEVTEEEYTAGKSERVHETLLINAVAIYNLCGTYRRNGTDNRGRHTYRIMLVGKEANMEACKIMCDYVFEAMERGAKALKGEGRETVFAYKKAFCITLSNRIYALKKEEEMTTNTDCKDLVVMEDAAVKNHMDAKNLKQGKPINTNVKDIVGFLRGQIDASKLSLNKQIDMQSGVARQRIAM